MCLRRRPPRSSDCGWPRSSGGFQQPEVKGTARCIPCDPRDFRVWRSCGRAGIVWATARSRRRQSSRNGLDHRLRRPGRDQYAMAPLSPAEAAVTCEASRTDGSAFTRSGTTVMASADPQLRISPTVSSAACRNWLPVAEILGDPAARRRSFGLLRHHRQRARGGATIYIGTTVVPRTFRCSWETAVPRWRSVLLI